MLSNKHQAVQCSHYGQPSDALGAGHRELRHQELHHWELCHRELCCWQLHHWQLYQFSFRSFVAALVVHWDLSV